MKGEKRSQNHCCLPILHSGVTEFTKNSLLKPLLSSVLHYLSLHLPRWEGRGGNFALTLRESHVLAKVFSLSLILNALITFQFHVLSFLLRFLPQSYKVSAGCFDLSPSTASVPSQGVKGEGSNAAAFTQALQHRFNHTRTLPEDPPRFILTAQIFL